MHEIVLAKQIDQVVGLFKRHVRFYVYAKRQIAGLKISVQSLVTTLSEFESRIAVIRTRLPSQSPTEQLATLREVHEIEKDIARDRTSIAHHQRKIETLECDLEATWDLW
ncbi:hypothetical protein HY524_01340 [Candidatus Berkelbacteria bacterium]|nr:hypothetical protein [Candidatus Berkelbacteria bacterium]